LSNIKTFESLRNPGYRLYFLGMIGQWGSMNMQMVTRSLLIYRLTGSAAILGLMSLAGAIPMILLCFYGGAIADRMQKKHVIQAGQAASALVALSVAIALTTGYLSSDNPGSWWILLVNSVLQGIIMALMMPSRSAIIPEIVGGGQVMNAVALSNLGMNSLRLLAPGLAGFIIDAFNFEAVFYTMTGLYIMSIILTSFIPTKSTPVIRTGSDLDNIREGLKYMWNTPTIFSVIIFGLVVIVLSMPYQMLMPIFTDDILKVSATGLGILMSVSGLGAILGSLTLASLPAKRRGVILLSSAMLLGVALACFSFSRSWFLSLGLILIVGLGNSGCQTLGNVLLQSYSEPAYLGRVMSTNMLYVGLSQLGTFVAGIIAESVGVQWAIGGFAALLTVIAALNYIFVPRMRKLD
jgi:MFS family permease